MIDRDVLLRALSAKTARHDEVSRQLSQPEVAGDHNRVRVLARELGQLAPLAKVHRAILEQRATLEGTRELLEADDPEMRELAELEVEELEERLEANWDEAESLLAEDDELSERDVLMEIRAAVGGDEAALFAGELFDAYCHFCARHKLKVEVLDSSPGEVGGLKEVVAEVRGPGAYRLLRFESGGHRIQRVPKTETQGRIHTSLATVAVLPKAEELDVSIDWEKDVREDKMRAGGPGGQKVNKTESAIRLTHLDTGITVHIQDEKSQHKNRSKARQILSARVFDHFHRKAQAERAAKRKGMIGTGDRSDRIRTYNEPQNRVTDHRIEWSFFDVAKVKLGEFEPFHERLRLAEREERLLEIAEALEEEPSA